MKFNEYLKNKKYSITLFKKQNLEIKQIFSIEFDNPINKKETNYSNKMVLLEYGFKNKITSLKLQEDIILKNVFYDQIIHFLSEECRFKKKGTKYIIICNVANRTAEIMHIINIGKDKSIKIKRNLLSTFFIEDKDFLLFKNKTLISYNKVFKSGFIEFLISIETEDINIYPPTYINLVYSRNNYNKYYNLYTDLIISRKEEFYRKAIKKSQIINLFFCFLNKF